MPEASLTVLFIDHDFGVGFSKLEVRGRGISLSSTSLKLSTTSLSI